jgi:hypothetical protein
MILRASLRRTAAKPQRALRASKKMVAGGKLWRIGVSRGNQKKCRTDAGI